MLKKKVENYFVVLKNNIPLPYKTKHKMAEFNKYTYLFPPRPEHTTHPNQLGKYDNDKYIAQPKYNGSCCNVFISEHEVVVMNRHKGKISSDYSKIDFKSLLRGKGWMVLSGEFLNKNKNGESGKPFNLKFVIWDILVYNSEYLIGSTFESRVKLLDQLYPCVKMRVGDDFENFKHICFTNSENVYRAPNYYTNFELLFHDLAKTDLYEGVVLKRRDGKLAYVLTEKNNHNWQIKARKPTKNYDF
jgi:ATP-dependent DNA ligase